MDISNIANLTTIVWTAGILITLISFLAVLRKEKKVVGINKLLFLIPLVVGVGIILMQLNVLSGIGLAPLTAGVTLPSGELPKTPSGICAVEDTTVTLSATDRYTTAPSGGTHRYKINENPASTVSDAGTLTASPGDRIKILWGNETSSTYFGVVTDEVVPCAGTKTFTAQTEKNGSLTISVFNSPDNNLISASTVQTIGSGEDYELEMEWKGASQYGFSHGGIFVIDYPKTNYTAITIEGLSPGILPSVYSISSVYNTAVAYAVPSMTESTTYKDKLKIDTATAVNPDAVGGNFSITFLPNDYFVNEDLGGIFDGPAVEDEKHTATLLHTTKLVMGVA